MPKPRSLGPFSYVSVSKANKQTPDWSIQTTAWLILSCVDNKKNYNLYKQFLRRTSSMLSTAPSEHSQYWNDISGSLIALGADRVGIDLLKSSAIGETGYMALLTKWKVEEDEVKEMLCELKVKVQKLDARDGKAMKQTALLEQLSKCEFAQHTGSH